MKKRIALLCALIALFSLCACQKQAAPPQPEAYTYEYTRADAARETTVPAPTGTAAQTTATAAETTSTPTGRTTEPEATTAPAASPTVPAGKRTETTVPPTTLAPVTAPSPATAAPATAAPTTRPAPTTHPAPATQAPTTEAPTQTPRSVCTVEIRCDTVLKNTDKLKKNKAGFLPTGGIILPAAKTAVEEGDTVFDVLRRACAENTCPDDCVYCRAGGIQLEYTYTPGFDTTYVEGIHQLYEKDCGSASGWMFSVNGAFPNVGASSCPVSPGDVIVFAFTCDMGDDIGNTYDGN